MPNDQIMAIMAGIVRHGIGFLGAALATHGLTVTGTQMDTLAGAVMVIVAVAWSWWQKRSTVSSLTKGGKLI